MVVAPTFHGSGSATRRRRWIWTGIIVVAVLIFLHLTLPFAIRKYVVHTLNKIPGYHANVEHISVNLFRGAYQIRHIDLKKTSGNVPVPFFSADVIDLSVQWDQLFHGAVVAKVKLEHPSLNFVNSKNEENSQTSVDKSWMQRVKELFPLEINRFDATDAEIHFRDFSRQPNVDVFMTHVHAVAENLTNSRRLSHRMPSTMDAIGVIPPQGGFRFHLVADPFAEQPTFQLAAEMTGVALTQWNNFLEAYGGIDAVKGEFSVFTEMKVEHGALQGYIKPILNGLEIKRWKDFHESMLKVVWENIVAGVAEVLKNHPKDQIATRIPLSGNIARPTSGTIAMIGELLRNAYIQALFPSLEGSLGRSDKATGDITKESKTPS